MVARNYYAASEPGSVVLAFLLNHSPALGHIVSHLHNKKGVEIWKEKVGIFHETKVCFLNWSVAETTSNLFHLLLEDQYGTETTEVLFHHLNFKYQKIPNCERYPYKLNTYCRNCQRILAHHCLARVSRRKSWGCCCGRCARSEQYRCNWKQQGSVGKQ